MSEKFAFLRSPRFWKLFLVALLMALQQHGYITSDLYDTLAQLIELWIGGSVIVGTVDRVSEKLGGIS